MTEQVPAETPTRHFIPMPEGYFDWSDEEKQAWLAEAVKTVEAPTAE